MTTATDREAFPVQWDDPADAERCWMFEPVHMPSAVTPLEFELGTQRFLEGFGWGMKPRQFNYFIYFTFGGAPPGEQAPGKPTPDAIREGGRRWHDEVLPEILAHTERYRTTDFASMTDEQLAGEIERLPDLRYRSGELHTLAITPHWQGMSLLIETYKELTDGDDLGAIRLVQGYGDKSFEAGERLWQVSRGAASISSVRERLAAIDEPQALELLAALRGEPAAAPFVEAFDAYLEEYGWRSGGGFGAPTWFEDPTVPLMIVRAHLETDGYDPNAEQRRLVDEREAAVRETMASLDEAGRTRLQEAIDAARAVAMLSEDHNFFLDQRLWCMPRRLIMAAADQLVATGALVMASDVFFLRATELCAALRRETEGIVGLAALRKEEFAHWKDVAPPPYVGAAPQGGPAATPVQRDRNGELRGTGASAGVARGPARIVGSLNEAGRLRPGDVLVTRVTQPSWTPLFAVASAVITEVGGMLTHTAIAAREYGIPAIVALPDAMRRIQDGRLIEVDGSKGTVTEL